MRNIRQFQICLFVSSIFLFISSCSKSGGGGSGKSSADAVTTVAGTGSQGAANGTGTAASFTYPSALAFGGTTLYVGDFGNSLVRTINVSSGAVATFAGTGTAGLLNGAAASAEFNGTANIAFDAQGDLFVADEENNVIREISSAGTVTTVAGSGVEGYQDGAASTAEFDYPEGIVVDGSGNLYVADGHNAVIRKITISTGMVSTYAGTAGSTGFTNGALATATFDSPYGLALDGSGNIYVTDIQNNCIRKITVSTGMVSTYAGTGAQGLVNGPAATATFYYPLGITFDSNGNLYVSDTYNNVIRKVSASGTVTTFAGTGTAGSANGTAATATFNFPIGIAVSGDGIYVADTHNNLIRKITVQ
jgi:sugar lactone lactonase YvrE